MPRTKDQNTEIRKDKVLLIQEVAMKLFANKGYHSTSIANIAKKANISKGLLYNYFESKEALLKFIFYNLVEDVMTQLIPNNESQLSNTTFIDTLFDVVIEQPQKWKAFIQLGMQQEVMDIMINENLIEKLLQYQNLLFNYFVAHEFEDILVSILHFTSLYKGFTMSYVFAPELFDKNSIERFKMGLKKEFERPSRTKKTKIIEIDEFMGYLLM